MHNLSMVQALSLWSDLEAAYYGKNGFGGDTAQIYVYRAMQHEPFVARLAELGRSVHVHTDADIPLDVRLAREAYDTAHESLHALFVHFATTHRARIEVEGRELGEWFKSARFDHRIHVKVTPR